MSKYKQLTYKERYQIFALLKLGYNYTQIANLIGVSKSTISRELKRNTRMKKLNIILILQPNLLDIL